MGEQGSTVFERWHERRRVAGLDTEERYVNPLDVRLGDFVSLDLPTWETLDLRVSQFRVVTRQIGEREFPFTDYFLLHRGLDADTEARCMLRFIPLDEPDPDSGRTHSVYLLQLVDEFEHKEEVQLALEKNEGFTYFSEEGEESKWVEQVYPARVNDIAMPYKCQVDVVKDENHDGEVDLDEVESHELTYWDFWRLVSAEGNQNRTEYLFVEVDEEDGWTELFQGEEIDQDVVRKS